MNKKERPKESTMNPGDTTFEYSMKKIVGCLKSYLGSVHFNV